MARKQTTKKKATNRTTTKRTTKKAAAADGRSSGAEVYKVAISLRTKHSSWDDSQIAAALGKQFPASESTLKLYALRTRLFLAAASELNILKR